jgi:hypothetical protein
MGEIESVWVFVRRRGCVDDDVHFEEYTIYLI